MSGGSMYTAPLFHLKGYVLKNTGEEEEEEEGEGGGGGGSSYKSYCSKVKCKSIT